jgi:hypothetical protein
LGRGFREEERKRYLFRISKGRREEGKERERENHLLLVSMFSITNLFDPARFLGPL